MKRLTIILFLTFLFAGGGFWWLWGSNFQNTGQLTLHETTETKIKGANVSLAVSDILLFKTPESDFGAIQFIKMTPDSGADYFSWFLPLSSKEVDFHSVKAKKGHVFEKYWRTRTGFNSYHVTDIGGKYTIAVKAPSLFNHLTFVTHRVTFT